MLMLEHLCLRKQIFILIPRSLKIPRGFCLWEVLLGIALLDNMHRLRKQAMHQ